MPKTIEASNIIPIIAIALSLVAIGLYINLNSNVENLKRMSSNGIDQANFAASNAIQRPEYENKLASMDKYRNCINRATAIGIECIEAKIPSPGPGANSCGFALGQAVSECDSRYWPNTG